MAHPFIERLLASLDEKVEGSRDALETNLSLPDTCKARGRCEAFREAIQLVEELDKSVFGEVDDYQPPVEATQHEPDTIDGSYLP